MTTYERLRGLGLRALAKLAQYGLVVAPDEGLDLIHDFWIDAWPDISERLRPEGNQDGYIYKAFQQWARPRILQMQRWKRSLADPIALEREDVSHVGFDGQPASEADAEAEAVIAALASLPEDERELLDQFFGVSPVSERSLAESYRLSRYSMRKRLIAALSHLAGRLERPEAFSQEDWELVRSVWSEGCTPSEAAALHSVPKQHVDRALRKGQILIETAVRRSSHRPR